MIIHLFVFTSFLDQQWLPKQYSDLKTQVLQNLVTKGPMFQCLSEVKVLLEFIFIYLAVVHWGIAMQLG